MYMTLKDIARQIFFFLLKANIVLSPFDLEGWGVDWKGHGEGYC